MTLATLSPSVIKKIVTKIEAIDGVGTDSSPPRYWFSTGNAALNKIISNNFYHGIPQGRVTGIAGPSGSGKSYITTNCMREAQRVGAFVLAVDTENAIDDHFVSAVGFDPTQNYQYISTSTFSQTSAVVSGFIKGYKAEYGTDVDAPRVLIVIDSLDMLLTDTEYETYDKGETKGDQGQRAKQIKAMLRTFVQDIKDLNISMIVTSQVYKANQQQLLEGEGAWVVNAAVRYALSQIILCTRLKLKDKDSKMVSGIRMKCESFKTRFSKPFQSVTIEVPYDSGMEFYNGVHEILSDNQLITKSGAWNYVVDSDIKYKGAASMTGELAEQVLNHLANRTLVLKVTEESIGGDISMDQDE